MRSLISVYVVISLVMLFLFSSCSKDENVDQQVRVLNQYSHTITNLHVGSVEYGVLEAGTASWYELISPGVSRVVGDFEINGVLFSDFFFGEVSFDGDGVKYWDLSINADRSITLSSEDYPE